MYPWHTADAEDPVASPVHSPVIPAPLSPGPGAVYEFCDFRLDSGRFELLQTGRRVRLERKPMELLILLVSREGQLVSRAEIAERLWSSEVFVDTEHGINTAIRKLRYLLHDDPDDPHFIQTVTGRGYRFVATVSTIAPVLPPSAMAEPSAPAPMPPRRSLLGLYVGAGACVVIAFGGLALYRSHHRPPEVRYTQLTDFTDSAVAPAVSPDGRMVGFIRGGNAFLTTDQIYVKTLPDGEARRVTDDARPKYGLAFSPDGSEIAYTVLEQSGFSTYEVSSLGGEPHLLLRNAAGLVWLDSQHLLFSELRSGIHMGVVTSTMTSAAQRDVYFPAHERGMAHYSSPSPDRHWDLVVEMNGNGDWARCRLVGLEGQGVARPVGPAGACTAAGWSSDGAWMYFTVEAEGRSHLWRQRFPDGQPEQLTFGPTSQEGIAMASDGKSLITSVGSEDSTVWMHDKDGDHQISSEGNASSPKFSSDGHSLYFLMTNGQTRGQELWVKDVTSGKVDRVLPGYPMQDYSVSSDGKEVAFTMKDQSGRSNIWVAPTSRRASPARISSPVVEDSPFFLPDGDLLFRAIEGGANFLYRMKTDGSARQKITPQRIMDINSVSPDGRWVIAGSLDADEEHAAAMRAFAVDGSTMVTLSTVECRLNWDMSGKFAFLAFWHQPGGSYVLPMARATGLPQALPFTTPSIQNLPNLKSIPLVPQYVESAVNPSVYAYTRLNTRRNLYRVPLP